MANDYHANYGRIGFIVCVGIVAMIATLVYIGGMGGRDSEMLVETCYDQPVAGLSVGSVVNLRGVKVGEVRDVGIIGQHYRANGEDNFRVYILMALDRRIIRAHDDEEFVRGIRKFVDQYGLRATVTPSGITGLSRVELDFNPVNPPAAPRISWKPEYPFIPPKVSLLDNFSVAATKVMNQINRMDMSTTWSNVQASVESFAHATESAKVMLEAHRAQINQIMENVLEISSSAKDLVSELKRQPSLLIREWVAEPLEETAR